MHVKVEADDRAPAGTMKPSTRVSRQSPGVVDGHGVRVYAEVAVRRSTVAQARRTSLRISLYHSTPLAMPTHTTH